MRKILFFFFLTISLSSFSQIEDAWVFLKDKPNKTIFLENPLTMLSQRALDRRNRQNIIVDEKDVPIDDNYLNQLKIKFHFYSVY